ncbi:MAG: ABC transporter ATP-binding protein/permease [Proteobacteria bacterium]|nr:ABC transporter ATP-binding protein/permease [Pseudomonadota bacterium]MDA0861262.1 ABC transporter ATP-binding protein/permease [Pseudomonadota bacterium]MDA1030460.1 ABC transporter ATP-binding protein/permease [Pseudomonadota bacterium]
MNKTSWLALKSLAPYLWDFKYRVVVALALLSLAKVANVTVPLVLKDVVDSLAPKDQLLVLPLALLLGYGALRFCAVLFAELRDVVFVKVTRRATRRIALKVFRHLHNLSLRFHLERYTGGISREIERGTRGISTLLTYSLFSIIPVILEFSFVAAILLDRFDWRFAAITFSAVFLYLLYTFFVSEWRMNIRREANGWDTRSNSHAVDSLLNYETVKYFNNEEYEARRYDSFLREYERADVKTETSLGLLNIGQSVIIAIAVTSLMILTSKGVVAQNLTIGDLVLVNGLLIQLYIPLNFMGMVYREIKQAFIDMNNMFSLLDTREDVIDRSDCVPMESSRPSVEFKNVSFSYDGKRHTLSDVSFVIPFGKTVAVVGESGSGKTTLARLLFRLYDVDQGEIRLDGKDIRNYSQASYRKSIGVVPQDTVLFNDTLGFNIRYGNPSCNEEDLDRVVRLAQLEKFIQSLPEGYETTVGERGLKVSGGEKQRISIARAILKDPPIMVFDEATSSLDSGSERQIQLALDDVSKNRTTLVIAHRLSTIIHAHEIVVLDEGKVIERGTHNDLLESGGRYAHMWHIQQNNTQTEN